MLFDFLTHLTGSVVRPFTSALVDNITHWIIILHFAYVIVLLPLFHESPRSLLISLIDCKPHDGKQDVIQGNIRDSSHCRTATMTFQCRSGRSSDHDKGLCVKAAERFTEDKPLRSANSCEVSASLELVGAGSKESSSAKP